MLIVVNKDNSWWSMVINGDITSGKHTKNDGKIHHFSWENSLFQWQFSIANCWHNKRVPIQIWIELSQTCRHFDHPIFWGFDHQTEYFNDPTRGSTTQPNMGIIEETLSSSSYMVSSPSGWAPRIVKLRYKWLNSMVYGVDTTNY